MSRLGELLNTLENVHFFPPRGKKCPPGTPPKTPDFRFSGGEGAPRKNPEFWGILAPGGGPYILAEDVPSSTTSWLREPSYCRLDPLRSQSYRGSGRCAIKLSGIWALRYRVIGDLGAALSPSQLVIDASQHQ